MRRAESKAADMASLSQASPILVPEHQPCSVLRPSEGNDVDII